MSKVKKKPNRPETHRERSTTSSPRRSFAPRARIKEFSKRVLHDYVIPMTRNIQHRLLRLEQSL